MTYRLLEVVFPFLLAMDARAKFQSRRQCHSIVGRFRLSVCQWVLRHVLSLLFALALKADGGLDRHLLPGRVQSRD